MARVRFTLKRPDSSDYCLIIVRRSCARGDEYRASTGESVKKSDWLKSSQRVKEGSPEARRINDYLDGLESQIKSIVTSLRASGVKITRENIAKQFADWKKQVNEKRLGDDVLAFLKNWIAEQKAEYEKEKRGQPARAEVVQKTLYSYESLQTHLEGFVKHRKLKNIGFGEMDAQMFDEFDKYMIETAKLGPSTSASRRTYLLRTLERAFERKATDCKEFERITVSKKEEESDFVYLTEEEIGMLYAARDKMLKAEDGHLVQHEGDRLVIGCNLGLRISDNVRMKQENFQRRESGLVVAAIKTGKTGAIVKIPLTHEGALELLRIYKWRMPPRSWKNYGPLMREACRIAGIKSPVITKSGEIKQKWEMVSSHTMRRSLATNLYKRGVPVVLIMKITGHKSITSFMKYLRIDKEEAAEMMAKHLEDNDQSRSRQHQ